METPNRRRFEIQTVDGKTLFSFCIVEVESTVNDISNAAPETSRRAEGKVTEHAKADQSLMTEAQKRYLFRMLEVQGIEGEKAHQHLKNLFQAETLKEVTKKEASELIERMIEQTKGNGHGPSLK